MASIGAKTVTGDPIQWDALLVSALARELDAALRGVRVRGLQFDHAGGRVLLHARAATLEVGLSAGDARIVLWDRVPPRSPGERIVLPSVIERVEAPPDERVLRFRMRRVRGGEGTYVLALELIRGQENAVLHEASDHGPATMRHVLRARSGKRPLQRGLAYPTLPPSRREGLGGDLGVDRWREILAGVPAERRRAELLARIAWTSPLNADAILGFSASDPELEGAPAALASDVELAAGHARWAEIVAALRFPRPALLRLPSGLQPYPLPLPGADAEPVPSLVEALRLAAESRGRTGAQSAETSVLLALEAKVERSRKRRDGLARELANVRDPLRTRGLGDLLLARYAQVPRGAVRVTLEDFEGVATEVELDPALPPHENAERYYEAAARAERALERIPCLIDAETAELTRLEQLLARARVGDAGNEELLAELPTVTVEPGAAAATPLPYRRYRSSGGIEIRVGKGAKANDETTFRHSAPMDVWLHARDAAGAHVILRWSADDNPPARDLEEAAVLAALNSRARTSGTVPVDWTRRKHIRKPRGAAPGSVVPERVRTIFVSPDPEVEERLRER
jgi:hypothetical protein